MEIKSLREALSMIILLRVWFLGRGLTRQREADAEESVNCLRYIIRRRPELLREEPLP